MENVTDILENFINKMASFDIKVMELHINNLDKLKLYLISEKNNKAKIANGVPGLFYGLTDFDILRILDKEWWIEYCWDERMGKEAYLKWRPSFRKLLEFNKPVIAEVGVLEGFNAKLALSFIDFGKYYMVDPYKEYTHDDLGHLHKIEQSRWDVIYQKVKERFSKYNNVELIRRNSEDASKDFKDESLDFVYLDGDHSYRGIYGDLHYWFPKVKKGGYLAGHDIENEEVKSAVYRFYLETYGEDINKEFLEDTVETEFNDWWIKKV